MIVKIVECRYQVAGVIGFLADKMSDYYGADIEHDQ